MGMGGRIGATDLVRLSVESFLRISVRSGGGLWSWTGSRFVEDLCVLSAVVFLLESLLALCLSLAGGGEVEGGLGEAVGVGDV